MMLEFGINLDLELGRASGRDLTRRLLIVCFSFMFL